jgi:hypothetical protein
LRIKKEPFKVECRAIDFEHSCCYKDEVEPPHPDIFLQGIESIIAISEGFRFVSTIKSRTNSYQMDSNFDDAWVTLLKSTGKWKEMPFDAKALKDIPDIKPDSLLSNGLVTVAVEIEKSNEKTIWFDLIKFMMLINRGIVQFGLMVAPRNYGHRTGVWHPFDKARFYKYCLHRFANVDIALIKSIAVLGYTQEAKVLDSWSQLNKDLVIDIKRQAERHFSI